MIGPLTFQLGDCAGVRDVGGARRTRIKFCGITNTEDAHYAVECGADALGFIFAESPRRVAPSLVRIICASLPPFIATVGVFVNSSPEYVQDTIRLTGIWHVQLHGDEDEIAYAGISVPLLKRINVTSDDNMHSIRERCNAIRMAIPLLDPGCGGGKCFDWAIARGISRPWLLAGGLNAGNVAHAIRTARPFGVDVCSGIEGASGRKDREAMRLFADEVRRCDAGN